MKSIGDTLKKAREEKSYSIDDVARETNIAKRYLSALEAEDFSVIHGGEAYILGFLKNYGDFLGLDPKELLNQYRVLKIQEAPVPLNELLKRNQNPSRIAIPISISVIIFLFIVGAIFFVVNMQKSSAKVEQELHKPVQYELTNNILEKRLYKDDSVIVPVGDGQYKITVGNIGDTVTLNTPQGNINLNLNTSTKTQVSAGSELAISTSDYSKVKPSAGAMLRFELLNTGIAAAAPENAEAETQAPGNGGASNGSPDVIWTAANPFPFTLQISFQGYCMFRWEILREAGRQTRNEKYFSKGEDLNIQAQNGVRLWVSNAGALRMQAMGGGHNVPVELGTAGEIIVSDILWRREDSGRYALVKSKLEN